MSFLLDTNVVSELRKRPGVADLNVVAWSTAQTVGQMFISVVTVLELEIGIARVERRDVRQGRILRGWLEEGVLEGFADRVLPIGLDVVRRVAPLHVPDPRPERDAYIAATAMVAGLTVATRNVKDFEPTGVALLNPWQA